MHQTSLPWEQSVSNPTKEKTCGGRMEVVVDFDLVKKVDLATQIVAYTINPIGMLLNGVLIYVIVRGTPQEFKSYSILLFNFAVCDFCSCFSALLAIQKTVFSGFSLTYVFHGTCGRVSPFFCYFLHTFVCHCFAHSQWILMVSFIYRYCLLIKIVPKSTHVSLICFGFYLLTVAIMGPYLLVAGDSRVLRAEMTKAHPEYRFDDVKIWPDLVVSGNESILSPLTAVAIAYMCLSCVPVYTTVIIFRYKTLALLESNVLSMSEATKRIHRQLIKALTLQASIPCFWVAAASLYLLCLFGVIRGSVWIDNVIFRIMECMPTISPLISLYFITPYRRRVRSWIKRDKKTNPSSAARSYTAM
ncbi:unnamed protein product [Caenorhabditis auriculariae]|uniref:G-protein coupled receptors family 1 profile domain-containing protein n=1 Tax=Caenorhabditis auriculariae TaxID=2777116 RepID=A0A8S1H894_9PELO|nr:unnamed protein product [Caenorhabditis auriculariae]